MSISALEREISKHKSKISDLERQIDQFNHEKLLLQHYLDGLLSAQKLIGKPDPDLREGSDVAKVKEILKNVGHPLHISKLAESLGDPSRSKRVSLSSSLNSHVKLDRIFTKPEPNVFGLKEFAASPWSAKSLADSVPCFASSSLLTESTVDTNLFMQNSLLSQSSINDYSSFDSNGFNGNFFGDKDK